MVARARIYVLTSVSGLYDYRVPSDMSLDVGSVVRVPFGSRTLGGVVWEIAGDAATEPTEPSKAARRGSSARAKARGGETGAGADSPRSLASSKLRSIDEQLALAPLAAPLRRFVDWMADYYIAAPGAVLRMVLPKVAFLPPPIAATIYRATGETPKRMTKPRRAALEAIGKHSGSLSALAERAGVSRAVLKGLVDSGALEPLDSPQSLESTATAPPTAPTTIQKKRVTLNAEQRAAAEVLTAAVRRGGFAPMLLDGVTGSGKTEVYMEAVATAVQVGQQALILLPEIALTEPLLARFAAYFGIEPCVWHSDSSHAARRRAWNDITKGKASIIIGARSALFLPYRNLGVIIVDEAHDTSFKQEDGVPYHARDAAVIRASCEEIPIVLASATPALESLAQVEMKRYQHLRLPSRHGGATLPNLQAINLCLDAPPRGAWIAPPLLKAMQARLDKGEQTLLFLNRRGYAPLTLCRSCGYRFKCPHCTFWMVEHRQRHRLSCHYCGHTTPPPSACPKCDDRDGLVACGPGVERIAAEVQQRFPDARTIIATSDTLWSPSRIADFVSKVEHKAVDIIIGTQIITKGYHFPDLTLVGVLDADVGLEGGDLRAAERCFQQIQQVAGRAGRGAVAGEVLIQTHMPQAPVIAALIAGDREGFYAAEHASRRAAHMPPYGRLAALIISAHDRNLAEQTASLLNQTAPRNSEAAIYGPIVAPLAMLRGRHRFRLLVHAPRRFAIQKMIRAWLALVKIPRQVRVSIDIDPYNFL